MSRALAAAERLPLDAYATPAELALAICRRVRGVSGRLPAITTILEPSAGQGPFVRAAREVWPEAHITAVDLDERTKPLLAAAGANLVLVEDWPQLARKLANEQTEDAVDTRLVIGNPPYREAEEHIAAALDWLRAGDQLVFLLRLNFLGSRHRMELLKASPLVWVAPVIPRPSFTPDGGTDATEYGVYAWRKGRNGGRRLAPPIVWRGGKR